MWRQPRRGAHARLQAEEETRILERFTTSRVEESRLGGNEAGDPLVFWRVRVNL